MWRQRFIQVFLYIYTQRIELICPHSNVPFRWRKDKREDGKKEDNMVLFLGYLFIYFGKKRIDRSTQFWSSSTAWFQRSLNTLSSQVDCLLICTSIRLLSEIIVDIEESKDNPVPEGHNISISVLVLWQLNYIHSSEEAG